MAGPRYSLRLARWTDRSNSGTNFAARHPSDIFGEALFGVAHGFDSLFPTSPGLKTSANSFALHIGGGLNISLAHGLGLRAIEAHYVRTSLPNSVGETQNDLRLALGLTYRIGRGRPSAP